VLSGGNGRDFLLCSLAVGSGTDQLAGGLDADVFIFAHVGDSISPKFILDFSVDDGDLIHLDQIDADIATEEREAFQWIGNGAFSKTAGELRFESGTESENFNIIQGDVNGDEVYDFAIRVNKSAGDPNESFFVL
jgi:serralysin